jgi:hypothetical protein
MGCIEPFDGLPKELNLLGFRDASNGLSEDNRGALETLMASLHFLSHCSRSLICLQVFDKQRWLRGRDYNGCVTHEDSQLYVAGRRRNIVNIQTEYDRGNDSTLNYASLYVMTNGRDYLEGRLELPIIEIGRYVFDKVRGKIKDWLVCRGDC